jgi:hypothetical protein
LDCKTRTRRGSKPHGMPMMRAKPRHAINKHSPSADSCIQANELSKNIWRRIRIKYNLGGEGEMSDICSATRGCGIMRALQLTPEFP